MIPLIRTAIFLGGGWWQWRARIRFPWPICMAAWWFFDAKKCGLVAGKWATIEYVEDCRMWTFGTPQVDIAIVRFKPRIVTSTYIKLIEGIHIRCIWPAYRASGWKKSWTRRPKGNALGNKQDRWSLLYMVPTLPKTNGSPLKIAGRAPKGSRIVFQGQLFRCYVFREGNIKFQESKLREPWFHRNHRWFEGALRQ